MPTAPEPEDTLDARRRFHEERNRGIGATDTPKILGLSKYGTALTVWQRLTNPVPEEDEEPPSFGLPAWMGIKLQATVGELYTEATGYRVRAARGHYAHKEHPWLVCHLDFRVWGHPYILVEAKTRAYMRGWGEDGSAHVPEEVWAQVQHEMAVVGAQETHVAVLFGHHTFRVYRIPRDDVFINALIPRLERFWFENVVAGVPPEYSGHPMDQKALQDLYPDSGPFFRNATPTQVQVVLGLRRSIRAADAAAAAAEDAKAAVKGLIGDALGLIGPFGEITWKRTADSTIVNHEGLAAAYRQMVDNLLPMAHPTTPYEEGILKGTADRLPGIVAEFTTTREGSRRFAMKWSDEES